MLRHTRQDRRQALSVGACGRKAQHEKSAESRKVSSRKNKKTPITGCRWLEQANKSDGANLRRNQIHAVTCAEHFSKLPRQSCVAIQESCCAWSRKVPFRSELSEYRYVFCPTAQTFTPAWATGLPISMATLLVCFSVLCIIMFQAKRGKFQNFVVDMSMYCLLF